MNKLPTKSLANKGKGRFIVAAAALVATMFMGLAGTAGASPVDDSATADIQAKTPVGEANAEAAPASDPIKACGPSPRDQDSSAWGKYFKGNYINIRRSPSTSSRICAQGQKSHRVDYHCYTVGSDGRTWTYLRDVATHYAGWVRDDLLVGNGSYVRCH